MANYKIDTPHAAVIIWNYVDRISGSVPSNAVNDVEQVIISTLSCTSIEISKSKGNPAGTFQLGLAPYKNWVSTITPGSWCVILMSQNPITEEDIRMGSADKVKMIGKIESVRVSTAQSEDGKRQTQYSVSGVDWGYIFNNMIYIDNIISNPKNPKGLGSGFAVALQNILFGDGGLPLPSNVRNILSSIIQIFGNSLKGFGDQGKDIKRLANAVYTFTMPQQMIEYMKFVGANGKPSSSQAINNLLTLRTGVLTRYDDYNNKSEAMGRLDPFSLQGNHSFWQILIENSNPALNEMFPEMRWVNGRPQFVLYNRIKPFSLKGYKPEVGSSNNLRSYFHLVKKHVIEPVTVIKVDAGTNWRDKYNFVEIKCTSQDVVVLDGQQKINAQRFDANAFEREGFRPLVVDTKQFPGSLDDKTLISGINFEALASWSDLLKEWYFDTHRMLNGTLTMIGTNEYIAVGDNIQFEAGLVNPNANMNAASVKKNQTNSILAHVENISHSFTNNNGVRSYVTTIQFVRGILVDNNGNPIGLGLLDRLDSSITSQQERNTKNVISGRDVLDPDHRKKDTP